MAKFWTGKPAITTAIALTVLGSLYIITSPTASSSFTIMHPTRAGSGSGSSSSSEVPGLDISLAQSSRNPPSITVTLKNNNKDTPYTLLKWGTPLDSAALNTGVFSIVAADSGDEVEQIVLQINRKMPPGDEEFVTVAPGTQEEVQVTFDKPWMPEQKPAKYKVKAQGEFKGLWDRMGDGIQDDDKNAYIESPFSGKKFSTNEIVLQVE